MHCLGKKSQLASFYSAMLTLGIHIMLSGAFPSFMPRFFVFWELSVSIETIGKDTRPWYAEHCTGLLQPVLWPWLSLRRIITHEVAGLGFLDFWLKQLSLCMVASLSSYTLKKTLCGLLHCPNTRLVCLHSMSDAKRKENLSLECCVD